MLKLAACVAGIYSCFLTWGYFQEKVSTTPYGEESVRFKYFIFLNMIQAISASATAYAYLKIQRKPLAMPSRMLLGKYFQVAFFNAIASPFSYAALKHIDYPTMILTKSCKLVPVMLMNILLYRRKFPTYKYVCVALITMGASGFMLLAPVDEHKKGAVNSSLYGMLLVIINLTIDGVTNSTQDQIFHTFKVTGQQMMCFMNLFMAGFMAIWLLNPFNSELGNALAFCRDHPAIIQDLSLFCLCGALGQCFIFYTLEQFGSLSLVTVTVTRKLFTILLSVVAYGHFLNVSQWLMVGVVFSGIGLEAYVKRNEKLEKMGDNLPKHSPKPDQISFSQVEMMKKDKIEDMNSNFVGMASNFGVGSGLAQYGQELSNGNSSTQLLQPPTQFLHPSYQTQTQFQDQHGYQFMSLQQQYQQQQQQHHSQSLQHQQPLAYASSSSAVPGKQVGGGGGGRQRTSVIAPKRH
ncbi:solute carrier family 35 (UDP-galactose transporter), member B1 [Entomortierella parvispora]|uniref:UDP-galactose transporter homolog 1 n=1 Tax=Entomortierella parvispora TaxID=205924 RepID=A0A9P3M2P5_9FUNG|nr:solute carrier family 35 (UDP-galactose transporter), member B1 [Entomortierella parvispora]